MSETKTDRIRFGLIGTGHWAQLVHAPGLAANPDVDFVGVWGRDSAKATELGAPYGAAGFADLDAFLDSVDAVAFAVPPSVQVEIALQVVAAGKHLLLEKPVGLDLASVDALVGAVLEKDLATVVFFSSRFVPVWETWLTACSRGDMLGGSAEWLTSHKGENNPYAGSVWRREYGALWDVGPHLLSQLIPVFGPVAKITGVRGAEDLVHLVLTHESGATSRMSVSQSMPVTATRVSVEFYGEGGWQVQPVVARDLALAYGQAVSDLVSQISTGERGHKCDIVFGREIIEVITRCEQVLGPR